MDYCILINGPGGAPAALRVRSALEGKALKRAMLDATKEFLANRSLKNEPCSFPGWYEIGKAMDNNMAIRHGFQILEDPNPAMDFRDKNPSGPDGKTPNNGLEPGAAVLVVPCIGTQADGIQDAVNQELSKLKKEVWTAGYCLEVKSISLSADRGVCIVLYDLSVDPCYHPPIG